MKHVEKLDIGFIRRHGYLHISFAHGTARESGRKSGKILAVDTLEKGCIAYERYEYQEIQTR